MPSIYFLGRNTLALVVQIPAERRSAFAGRAQEVAVKKMIREQKG
jgi:hypothetical protein